MRNCIHGFLSTESSDETDLPDETKQTTTEDDDSKKRQHKSKHEEVASKDDTNDDSENCDSSTRSQKRRRIHCVGIKHFATSSIAITSQGEYLGENPHILIIPILNAEQVKVWKGEDYHAIVLALDFKIHTSTGDVHIPANKVYRYIETFSGPLLFAKEWECSIACQLLHIMILCLCKSLKETFPIEFLLSHNKNKQDDLQQALHRLKHQDSEYRKEPFTVPVPRCKDWSNRKMNVRKIHFSNYTPDPVLLLGRSASNWLKWQHLDILPGYGEDTSTSDSSNNESSFSEKDSVTQGCLQKKPCIDEISFDPLSTYVEALSDDEDF
jgi:hypothetical protein